MNITDRISQPPRYKLLVENPSDLWETLRSASDIHSLARELAERVYGSDDITLKIDIIKRYHIVLAKDVVDVRKNKRKFFDSFIQDIGLSKGAAVFRNIFFVYTVEYPL